MKLKNNTYSLVGVALFDNQIEISNIQEEYENYYTTRFERIILTDSQIVNGLIYQRKSIAQFIKQFIKELPAPHWMVLSVDDRLVGSEEFLPLHINFHFFLFVIEAQLNCLFFTTHERAQKIAIDHSSKQANESLQLALGIYLLGKAYDEKNS